MLFVSDSVQQYGRVDRGVDSSGQWAASSGYV